MRKKVSTFYKLQLTLTIDSFYLVTTAFPQSQTATPSRTY